MADSAIDYKKAEELEERYDPEMQFRSTYALAKWMVIGLLFLLSLFHYYTAGFGVLTHHWHVGFHLAFVLGLIYLVYTPHRGVDGIGQIARQPLGFQFVGRISSKLGFQRFLYTWYDGRLSSYSALQLLYFCSTFLASFLRVA